FENLQRYGFNKFELGLVMKFQEISKIKKLLDLAEKMEQSKAAVRKPTETFLHIMNEFIENGEDGKKVEIDSMGRIFFTTKYSNNPISIQNLSSGEKQLITFFANLIFNVKSNSSGIFVVDEPELSLHLSWQKIFVEKTLELNKNIQLIFATHAPEIIGRRRNKMFKLEKQYVGTVE
ncbi:AAA family ATPase, partial [Anaerotruncus colihominis]